MTKLSNSSIAKLSHQSIVSKNKLPSTQNIIASMFSVNQEKFLEDKRSETSGDRKHQGTVSIDDDSDDSSSSGTHNDIGDGELRLSRGSSGVETNQVDTLSGKTRQVLNLMANNQVENKSSEMN